MLKVTNLYCGYDGIDIIKDISFECRQNTITAIIGQNGCGKTTLLKALARQLKTSQGSIFLDNKDIKDYTQKDLAKHIAVLPQVRGVPNIPAKALVMHGRFPYLGFPRIPSPNDKQIVKQVMDITNTTEYSNIDVATLSGGQRQRVYIAMLLAQQTNILLLDEPTTFLDMSCQFEVIDLLSDLKNQGKCIIVVMHDISQAMQIADNILLLDNGKQVFYGTPDELAHSDILHKHMNIIPHKINNENIYYFTSSKHSEK